MAARARPPATLGWPAGAVGRLERHRRRDHCPPPRRPERCDHCGVTVACLINIGRFWTDEASAPAAIGRARLRRGRHLVGLITAFRCPGVPSRQCFDADGKQWDLDVTDYTDDGSWDNSPKSRSAGRRRPHEHSRSTAADSWLLPQPRCGLSLRLNLGTPC